MEWYWKLPFLFLKVHSSPYQKSTLKTAADVIDQFRPCCHSFDPNIPECVGFAFPKYSAKTFVTKVTASFEDIHPLEDWWRKGRSYQHSQECTEVWVFFPLILLHALLTSGFRNCSYSIGSKHHLQQPTKHSILLKSESVFWKLIPLLGEDSNVFQLDLELKMKYPKHVTLYTTARLIGRQAFFEFPAQLPPLQEHQVEQCLHDFMTRTATALEELHHFCFTHLDVRIPNICFAKEGNKYIVKLIDLARSTIYRWAVRLE